jgi:muramidase (phage lysozyme)
MSRERYEAFRNTDVGQRLLNTIAFAEGTAGPRGYNTMFTHAQFDNNFVDHPRQLQRSNGLASDAAGRYQFLSTTWDPTARALGLNDFSPVNQDIGALYKAEQRLAQKGLSLDDLVEVGMSKKLLMRWLLNGRRFLQPLQELRITAKAVKAWRNFNRFMVVITKTKAQQRLVMVEPEAVRR